MDRTTRAAMMAGALYVLALAPAASVSQVTAGEVEGDGWHVVRPGDRLEDLAVRYLGDRELWRELWRLNPSVKDPDLLHPGSRVRVGLESGSAVPAARVEKVARSVEAKPEPQAWLPVGLHDYLIERDGVRTQDDSSTELRFSDGDVLRVGESSLVFLQLRSGRLRGTALADATPSGVDVVAGQADLEMRPAEERRAKVGVEVRVAGARAAVAAPAGETGRSRARNQAGEAQLMMFAGSAAVEAAGQTVDVPAGSGTSVPKGAAPRQPERLLPAPVLVAPADGAPQPLAAAAFSWRAVEGAAGYAVEVCADAACGQLVARAEIAAAETGWSAPPLAAGRYAWRVGARAASGLDGYPSAPRWFEASEITDRRAPSGRIDITGRSVETAGRKLWRSDAQVSVVVDDPEVAGEVASGVADWTLEVDGKPATREWLRGPFETGRHELVVRAVDQAGNEARVGPVVFDVDASAPAITWELVEGPAAGRGAGTPLPWGGRISALEWKAVDPMWLAWQWSEKGREPEALPLSWTASVPAPSPPATASAAPPPAPAAEIFLVASGAVTLGGDVGAALRPGAALRLRFTDAGGDLARASIRREPGDHQGGRASLSLEARDLLGNETRINLPLAWP